MLRDHDNGKRFIEDFGLEDEPATKRIEDDDRHEVVRVAAAHLIRVWGPYPTSEEKSKMASAIIESFPSLRIVHEGVLPNILIYNPKNTNNPLDRRLKMLRDGLPVESRKRKPSEKPPNKQ